MNHLDDLVMDYVLGMLDGPTVATIEFHLGGCPPCRLAVSEVEEDLAAMTLALPRHAPGPGLRDRLLSSARFHHGEALGRFFDLPPSRARALLEALDAEASWVPGPHGLRLMHLEGGASLAGADCGFVRMAAGSAFPRHDHLGEERHLVLEGLALDDRGLSFGPGDAFVMRKGEVHGLCAAPATDLLYALVVWEGVQLLSGEVLKA